MNDNNKKTAALLLALGALLGAGIAGAADAPGGAPAITPVEVEVGTHKLMREASGVQRVAIGNPAVADVNVVNRREVLVSGKSLGITSLMLWSGGKVHEYRIRVIAVRDPNAVKKQLDPDFLKAQIDPGRSLSGSLPNVLAHRRAMQEALTGGKDVADSSTVALESQVLADIRIAEVSRTTIQQYGLNVFKNVRTTLAGISTPGSSQGVSTDNGKLAFQSNSGFQPIQNAFNLVVGDPSHGLLGVLSILENKGLAHTLAEPSLVAMSGQTASFLAGGEFPVPVSQGNGAVTIQYKEFGVRLSLTPTILARDRIALKVAPEVSDLNFAASVSVGGSNVPSLVVRRTDTTVELGDGESFVISGLVSNTLLNNVDKVPWLGDLPILGAFFKNSTLNHDEKELIMVVTPHLVRPISNAAKLPALPGAEYDNYHPGMARMVFGETGKFRAPQTGFSQ